MTIAIVTAVDARRSDEDLPPLEKSLKAVGIMYEIVVWNDPAIDWSRFELSIVRSTWDYVAHRDEFLAWAHRVPRLLNPPEILQWNTDKHYLRELGSRVVPTVFVEPGDRPVLPGFDAWVVKPAISAGSIDTARHENAQTALDHVRRLQSQGRSVMIQPYIRGIEQAGETAMIYIDGRFSHAIRKGPILSQPLELVDGLYAKEDIRPRVPSPEELALADEIIRRVPGPLLYARVDLVPGPMLLEFEATEPSLFFNHAPGSADRFARAIAHRLQGKFPAA